MPDNVEPVIHGIEKRFRDLSVDVRGERLIRYIVNQLQLGRHIDAILSDSYVSEHTSAEGRAQMMQNPAVIRAIEDEIRQQFDGYRSATSHKDVATE